MTRVARPASWRIIQEVCAKHAITAGDIKRRDTRRSISEARNELFYRLRTETSLSYPAIARLLGGRNHTTVLRCVRKYCALLGLPGIEKDNTHV